MGGLHLRPWEPEETVGSIWHRLVGGRAAEPGHPRAAVTLESMRARMGLLHRGLGGDHGFDFRAAAAEKAAHRRGLLARIGHAQERTTAPRLDSEALHVPVRIDCFAETGDNAALYLWLAAWAALDRLPPENVADPLRNDLARLARVRAVTAEILAAAPGLAGRHWRLADLILAGRKVAALPADESAVEEVVRALLGSASPLSPRAQDLMTAIETGHLDGVVAPSGYKPFRPPPLWPDFRPGGDAGDGAAEHAETGQASAKAGDDAAKKARRNKSRQAGRRDSFILNRFETIKTWAESLDLNRKVDDDDVDNARKAAGDQDDFTLSGVDNKPATRLAFDLDLAPQDVDRVRLAEGRLLPEWDYRRSVHLPEHVRILSTQVAGEEPAPEPTPQRRRRIEAVRRQFEALMPQRAPQMGEDEGDDIDTDAAVRLFADRAAGHSGPARLFRRLVDQTRDLSVATLLDASRSTESIVEERPVIAIAREALLALGHGLQQTGDNHAVYAFSSLRRDKVFVSLLKGFDEPMGPAIESRIAATRPGFYTRMGAAIRHTTAELLKRGSLRRLLLVITDGKPNDLDYYEGRYGVEDTRKAVQEARMAGLAVFAIAIDRKAESYIPYIFGRSGYAIVSHPARLAEALPSIYRHLLT